MSFSAITRQPLLLWLELGLGLELGGVLLELVVLLWAAEDDEEKRLECRGVVAKIGDDGNRC
jgi:D-serine deaminase-like pyridoxal phosphate-dependent protein